MPRNYTPKKLPPTKVMTIAYCQQKIEELRKSKTDDETVEHQMVRLAEMKAYEDIITYIEGQRDDPSR